jgi:malate dehydrogenase (oxaloacetate-decarboxylating)
MSLFERSLALHYEKKGKIEVVSAVDVKTREDLSLAYTPGVAAPCLEIEKNPKLSYELTRRWNLVAVITDGTAVLGLGDIGPEAAMPVMEGKCVLFKEFADVDAFPLCINSKNTDEIVSTVALISKSFGGINLEDISAPRCFEIEEKLKKICDIPVFHDDQHGTAIVAGAALINALKLTERRIENSRLVINGAGSAGIAIGKHMLKLGIGDLIMCDKEGILDENRKGQTQAQIDMARVTNKSGIRGTLKDAMCGADVFIGVSGPNCVTPEMVRSMNKNPIIFAMSNPVPEIDPDEALRAGAMVVGTGRSDRPNQINNVLAFPGIFRGALDVRAKEITDEMKMAATFAIADMIDKKDLAPDNIIPSALNRDVAKAVAKAVGSAWVKQK